jgi:predicted deacylase
MRTEQHKLDAGACGPVSPVTSLHYGPATPTRPGHPARRALLQCSLHADEIPPMLVGWHLRRQLQALEEAGQLRGEVVLLPAANPLGLAQQVWGRLQGRFELASGQNFNRHYPQLAAGAARRFTAAGGLLGEDPMANLRALRAALREELAAQAGGAAAAGVLQGLRYTLMRLALDADVVLDLHCDNEAVLHLYATPEHEASALALGRCLGAPLALLAAESGDAPYDEAQSGIWPQLRALLGDSRGLVPLACFAATVELRGETDVDHTLAATVQIFLVFSLRSISDSDWIGPIRCEIVVYDLILFFTRSVAWFDDCFDARPWPFVTRDNTCTVCKVQSPVGRA